MVQTKIWTIKFVCDDEITSAEIKNYIKQELEAGGGNRDPKDPLFKGLKILSITGR